MINAARRSHALDFTRKKNDKKKYQEFPKVESRCTIRTALAHSTADRQDHSIRKQIRHATVVTCGVGE